MTKFLVIEGLDGSGKSTQIKYLKSYLTQKNIKFKDIHFPSLNKGYYGQIIGEYLRGELGTIDEVHPKLVALIFAGDRKENSEKISSWLAEGYIVIADRYVYSNVAFQCAKCFENKEKKLLKEWILNYEFKFNNIPVPTVSIFLDVPFESVKESITKHRVGLDRKYLNGKKDIHEENIILQRACKRRIS